MNRVFSAVLVLVAASIFSCVAMADNAPATPGPTASASLVPENSLDLSASVTRYMALLKEMKIEQSLDFVYPRLFELYPREKMVTTMRQMLAENDLMEMSIGDIHVNKLGGEKRFSDGAYAVVDYTQDMVMKIKGEKARDPKAMHQIQQMFEAQYGPKSVRYDEAAKTFTVTNSKSFVAIKDSISHGWKFISNDNGSADIQRILPPEVAAALK